MDLELNDIDVLPVELQIAISRGREDIVYFAETLLGLTLHEGQKRFLRNSTKKVNLLSSGNRWGKSVTIAIKHIHKCFYKIGIQPGPGWSSMLYRTGNIAPHSKNMMPVYYTIIQILESKFPIPQEDGSLKNNECDISWFLTSYRETPPKIEIHYSNNSYTEFASTGEDKGDSIQGRPFGYISYDEGGRSNNLAFELENNVIGRLADWNGQLDIPCTPDAESKSIIHHRRLFLKGKNGDPAYYAQEGSVEENIFLLRNNPTYVQETEARLAGDPSLRQVLYGEFVITGSTIFPNDDIMEASDNSLNNGVRHAPGHSYVIGIDTALGEDECVFTVLDTTELPYQVVRQRAVKGSLLSPQIHVNDLLDLYEHYNQEGKCKLMLETYNGEAKRFYLDLPTAVQRKTTCYGTWQPEGMKQKEKNTSATRQMDLIVALRKLLATKGLKIPNDATLIEQLDVYRVPDDNLETDRVFALALAVFAATDGKSKHSKVEFFIPTTSW